MLIAVNGGRTDVNRYIKTLFIITLAVLVVSCSFKTLYKQLDYLIPAYVEGMVSLDDLLEERVEKRSLALINWHRNTQLIQYAEWLRSLQRDANDQLTEADILRHIAIIDSFWNSLLLKVNEEMVILLPLLNTEQRDELFASMADKNENFRDEYVDIDEIERIDQFTERMMDAYASWLGDLSNEQERAIELAAIEMQATAELRLTRRLQWQNSIQRILNSDENVMQKEDDLRYFFKDFNERDNDALSAIEKNNRQVLAGLTVRLIHSMTEEQHSHFVSKTDDYIRMFTELAEGR